VYHSLSLISSLFLVALMILSFLLVDEISLAGTHLNHFVLKNFVWEFKYSRHYFVGFAIYFDSCSVHGNVGIVIIHGMVLSYGVLRFWMVLEVTNCCAGDNCDNWCD